MYTSDIIVIFQCIKKPVFKEYFFKTLLCQRLRDNELCVLLNLSCKLTVFVSLLCIGLVIDDSLFVYLCTLNLIVTGNKVYQLGSEFLCKCRYKLTLTVNITAVTDDTAEAYTALFCVACDTL